MNATGSSTLFFSNPNFFVDVNNLLQPSKILFSEPEKKKNTMLKNLCFLVFFFLTE